MKQVYVVTTGSYSDYGIRAIFSKKEHADLLAKRLDDANVESWELSKLKETKPLWLVWFYPQSAAEASQNQFAKHGEVQEYPAHKDDPCLGMVQQVGCYATDEAHAIKVASDMRAEYLDRKLNP